MSTSLYARFSLRHKRGQEGVGNKTMIFAGAGAPKSLRTLKWEKDAGRTAAQSFSSCGNWVHVLCYHHGIEIGHGHALLAHIPLLRLFPDFVANVIR